MTDPEPPGGPPSSDETLEGTSSTPGGSSELPHIEHVDGRPETLVAGLIEVLGLDESEDKE